MVQKPLPSDGSEEPRNIDHCERCGGLFIDFFDGDPVEVVKSSGIEHSGKEMGSFSNCPDCEVPLELSPLRLGDEQSSPNVARCDSCMGIFLTPSMAEEVRRYRVHEKEEGSVLSRVLSAFFGDS